MKSKDVAHHIAHPLDDSEVVVERWVFRHRLLLLLIFLGLSVWLALQAYQLRPQASFEKMIPTGHPYIQNYLAHQSDLKGLGNAVRIVVETTEGDIFTPEFQDVLRQVHDEVFYIHGVDRGSLKSLWAAAVRWQEVTEQGFAGGPVIPPDYDGSLRSIEVLQANTFKSGQVGSLVANNLKSAVIYAPLYDRDPDTGEALDYTKLSADLERLVRDKYQSDTIRIRITGFAKVVGDLIEGLAQVVVFFAAAVAITTLLLYRYCRCLKSTLIAVLCSITAVVWLLGLLNVLQIGLDPYSMLVPFLVFAIGVSHAVQIINAITHEAAKGASRLKAAQRAFRALYVAGLVALVSDGVGFATLMVIEIAVIQDLALAASIGIAAIIMTNLVLLPILISYSGMSQSSVRRLQAVEARDRQPVWEGLSAFARKPLAGVSVALAVLVFGAGLYLSQGLKIGDLDPGAPELRPDSTYNRDIAFITANYATSTDLFVVMVKTPAQQCSAYEVLDKVDQLEWRLAQLPGVQSTFSLADFSKLYMSAMNEGHPKLKGLNRNQSMMDAASIKAPVGLFNGSCSLLPVLVYLDDHKAATLERVVAAVDDFAREHSTDSFQVLQAAGNAGIEAATNIVIAESQNTMLIWVYGVVTTLVLLTFRSLRAAICIMVPLALTSVLCQVLMVYLGIGVKVATLPVIALGVGIGVDYGIYIYSRLAALLKTGMGLQQAYFITLKTTGKAVAFTGFTLAIGVGTWYFSPIKFQADMGVLLTFMFLWNMLGALTLLPALAHFLLKPSERAVSGAASEAAEVSTLSSEQQRACA